MAARLVACTSARAASRPARSPRRAERARVLTGCSVRSSTLSLPRGRRSRPARLDARRDEVNDLNVFPVADGDTGDNMVLTLRAVLAGARPARLGLRGPHDRRHRPRRDRRLGRARGAARGPRQLRRDPLAADPRRGRGARQPPRRARRPGADQRRAGARRRPGLRLGARARRGHDPHRRARDVGARRLRARAHAETDGSAPKRPTTIRTRVIAEVIEQALDAGQESVKRGPDLLPVLREAGVVDAGGYALTVLLAGIVGALQGTERPGPRAPRGGTRHPPAALVLDTIATAPTSRSPAATSTAQPSSARSSSSATRCSSSATRRRSRSTSTPTTRTPPPACSPTPASCRTSTSPTCTSRSRERDERLPRRASGPRRRDAARWR